MTAPDRDDVVEAAWQELVADAPEPAEFEALPWAIVAADPGVARGRRALVVATLALAGLLVGAAAIGLLVGDDTTDAPARPPVASTPADDPMASTVEEPDEAGLRQPPAPYLPTWVPEGFELVAVRWFEEPAEAVPPEPVDAHAVVLGDSEVLSDASVRLTARRFGSGADLERARWIEDALMVLAAGPSTGLAVDDVVFAYNAFPGPDGGVEGGQFHGVLDDVLLTGFVTGEVSSSEVARLLATVSISAPGVTIDLDPSAAGLVLLGSGPPPPGPDEHYWLDYSDGVQTFSAVVQAGAADTTITAGTDSRIGELVETDTGRGFVEAQPEVGGALGSRRVFWWVPDAAIQVWFGDILTDEQAIRFADSVQLVDSAEWEARTGTVAAEVERPGPLNLPDDPQQLLSDRLAELDRLDGGAAQPALDVAAIAGFVGSARGGSLPVAADVAWVGPVELDRLTSGADFLPEAMWHVLRAFELVEPTDDRVALAEARRQDVRGLCCAGDTVQLVEGLDADEAAVVAAHELTHLYDTAVVDSSFRADEELVSATAAVLEGNATRIMRDYRDANGLAVDLESRPYETPDLPPAVRRYLRFAYLDGERFARAIADAGGEAAIDAALGDDPPLSSEHILHPARYLAGDRPVSVTAPEPPDGVDLAARASLGAFVVALVAENELGWDAAVELAGAWAGDRYVAWSEGDRNCLAARVLFDDEATAAVFAELAGGTAIGASVDVRRCG